MSQITMKRIGMCAALLLVAGGVVTAKPWRGIVPLQSTRADVERVFGNPKQSSDWFSFYNLSSDVVVFHFQTEACDECGFRWNVPLGTVTSIGVIPKGRHRREEYQLASDAEIHDAGAEFVYYSDYSAGLTVETYKDQVTLVQYHPEAVTQKRLQCPRIHECIVDFSHKFDEYRQLTFADEKARLDNFVIQMKKEFGRGTIEVIGPSKRKREQLMMRAARAKRYLVEELGLEAERILLVDGGFNRIALTRLSLYTIGGAASRIYVLTQPHPQRR